MPKVNEELERVLIEYLQQGCDPDEILGSALAAFNSVSDRTESKADEALLKKWAVRVDYALGEDARIEEMRRMMANSPIVFREGEPSREQYLLDQYAGQALRGMLATQGQTKNHIDSIIAQSWTIARDMVDERNRILKKGNA